jgi:c-di-GMP-related signal transduction protein
MPMYRKMTTPAPQGQLSGANTRTLPGQRFVARQPIFDASEQVFGYELLFRNGFEECFQADPEVAARSTLDSSLLFGLNTLCDGRHAFVNCTREVLIQDLITLLPPSQVVVEILESVPTDDRVIAACRRLKKAGYVIALDDFAPRDPREALCEFADIVKVDIRATTGEERSALLAKFSARECRMLAEKVETQREFREAQSLGFVYFQGFFFRRPELMMAREVPASRVHYLRLLDLVSRPELDLRDLERLVKQDASICYRFLRYLNSPLFGFAREIRSVRHAIAMLGETELRRWIRLVVTLGAAEGRCTELILTALARARFCELMSRRFRSDSDLFLLGLLSIMDAILEISMDVLVAQLPLDREIKAALSGKPSKLRPLYQLMLAQESGEWQQSSALAKQLYVSDEEVAAQWWQAMQWAQQVTGGV